MTGASCNTPHSTGIPTYAHPPTHIYAIYSTISPDVSRLLPTAGPAAAQETSPPQPLCSGWDLLGARPVNSDTAWPVLSQLFIPYIAPTNDGSRYDRILDWLPQKRAILRPSAAFFASFCTERP